MKFNELILKYLLNYDNENSIVSKLRKKRLAKLLNMIEVTFKSAGEVKVIDIGGRPGYWKTNFSKKYLEDHNVQITIVNLPDEKGYLKSEHPEYFSFISADGCNLSDIKSNEFDISHSNSVIEHVGDWNRMVLFAKEVQRVAAKHFIQTPSYWFPLEPHVMFPFFHWLPKPFRVFLLMNFSLGNWEKSHSIGDAMTQMESARLLDVNMFSYLFKDSIILKEKLFFLTKSFIAIKE